MSQDRLREALIQKLRDAPELLRRKALLLRRKALPLSDFIPLIQQAADALAASKSEPCIHDAEWVARRTNESRKQALEEAALLCDRIFPSSERSGHEWSDGFVDGACDCADAIRSLIK